MNYEKVYNRLIQMRRINRLHRSQGYCEHHHIKPRSLYPELVDEPSNIVALTAREHYIAHHLLMHWYKHAYGEHSRQYYAMLSAFWLISLTAEGIKITAREFQYLRIKVSQMQSERQKGENNPMFGKKLKDTMTDEEWQRWLIVNREAHAPDKISAETRQKHSKRTTGKNNPMYGISPRERMDEETYLLWKKHNSESTKGEKNPSFNKKWLFNPLTNARIYVDKSQVDEFQKQGFVLGLGGSAVKPGSKHMKNPSTGHRILAKPEDVEKYLNEGYVFGWSNKPQG